MENSSALTQTRWADTAAVEIVRLWTGRPGMPVRWTYWLQVGVDVGILSKSYQEESFDYRLGRWLHNWRRLLRPHLAVVECIQVVGLARPKRRREPVDTNQRL